MFFCSLLTWFRASDQGNSCTYMDFFIVNSGGINSRGDIVDGYCDAAPCKPDRRVVVWFSLATAIPPVGVKGPLTGS
jgi:hypothetical protein